jgi:hypothetical protein|tara:strand:+ start:187 stop:753 length:567 start_codon:yes stop_codon:yes gene_type:complete
MARKPFTMRSGNKTSFKMMGSSPVKELVGKQKNIDMNNNNRIDAGDFEMLRKDSPAKLNLLKRLYDVATSGPVVRTVKKGVKKLFGKTDKVKKKKFDARTKEIRGAKNKKEAAEYGYTEGAKEGMSTKDKFNFAAGTVGEYEGGKALYNYFLPTVEVKANPPVNTDYSEEKKEKKEKKSKFITSDRDF